MTDRAEQNKEVSTDSKQHKHEVPLDTNDLIELISQVEVDLNRSSESDESESRSMLKALSLSQREEVEHALSAQRLLSQLAVVNPPDDLPINTARKARRRRRQEQSKPSKTWLDQALSLAVLVLIIVIISLIFHHLRDDQTRQRVEQLEVIPKH